MQLKTVEEKSQSKEWGAWKFVSEMLDTPHPDEELARCSIYHTSKCYEQIHDFVVEQKQKAVTQDRDNIAAALVEALEGKKQKLKIASGMIIESERSWCKKDGYNQALEDAQNIIRTLLESKN